MPKPEMEFIDADTEFEWKSVEGDTLGFRQKILSLDPKTGDCTRLLKYPPGVETKETFVHDYWEETFILEGSLYDILNKKTYLPGYYTCRPPGMKHGPFQAPYGCLVFTIRHHEK